jgi:putative MATE family efflux protein
MHLYSQLIRLSLPIMAGNFMQTIHNLADTWFLGRLGPAQLSAPGVSFSFLFLLVVIGGGFSSAGLTLISQSRGKGDREKQEFYLGQLVGFMTISGFVLAFPIYWLMPFILQALAVPSDVFPFALEYMQIMLLATPIIYLYFAFQNIMQGLGDSITPFLIQVVTVLLNIVFNWMLIFGNLGAPALGVAGAAWGTLIAQAIGVIWGFFLLLKGVKGIRLHFHHIMPKPQSLTLMMEIGLPAALGQSSSALGFTVLQGIVNSLGTPVIAAFSVGNRIINLFMLPALGMSQATTVMIGERIGAGRKDHAVLVLKYAVATIAVFISFWMTFTFFRGDTFVRFFIEDPEVQALGRNLFRIVSPSVVLFALFTVITGAFQGAGDTKPIMTLNMIRLWGLRLPIAWFLVMVVSIGPVGIWISMFTSNLVTASFGFYLLAKRPWMDRLKPEAI